MIPPSSSESEFNGNGATGAATGLLVPARSTMPAETAADWPEINGSWASEPAQHGVNPLEFVYALKRRWLVASSLSIGLAVTAMMAVYFFVPVNEEATAWLQVLTTSPSFLNDTKGKAATPADREANQQNQMATVKRDDVLDAALRDKDVQATRMFQDNKREPIKFLQEELRVGFFPKSDMMFVRMKGENKKDVVKIVNSVVAAYLAEVVTKEKQALGKKIADLREIVQRKDEELRTARQAVSNIQDTLGISMSTNAKTQLTEDTAEYAKLQSQLNQLEQKAMDASGRLAMAKGESAEYKRRPVPESIISQALEKDPTYVDLKGRAFQIESAYRAQLGLLGNKANSSASIAQMGQAYQDAVRQMKEYERQAGQKLRKQLIEPAELRAKLIENEAAILGQQVMGLRGQVKKMFEDLKNKGRQTEALEEAEDKVLRLSTFLNDRTRTLSDLELEQKAPDRITLLQDARLPEVPNTVFRIWLTLGSGFLTFLVSLVGVGGWEYFNRRVAQVSDVSKRLGMTVVGTLPALPRRPGGKVSRRLSTTQFDMLLADSIDNIRTSLIHGAASGGHRVVMVTSAWDGEGKTTVASQLAASLARCGRRTLLVDADVRNPTLHHLFELPPDIGVCEILRGEVEPRVAIRETPAANLWLLSAGLCDHRCIQALENDALGMVFAQLKAEYDFVIIDTAPVLAFADPLLIGQHVDGALVSVRLDHSQRPKVEEAVNRMKAVGIVIFGAVVNGTKPVTSRRAIESGALVATS